MHGNAAACVHIVNLALQHLVEDSVTVLIATVSLNIDEAAHATIPAVCSDSTTPEYIRRQGYTLLVDVPDVEPRQ